MNSVDRRSFKFNLRKLLLVTTAVCMLCALVRNPALASTMFMLGLPWLVTFDMLLRALLPDEWQGRLAAQFTDDPWKESGRP